VLKRQRKAKVESDIKTQRGKDKIKFVNSGWGEAGLPT
jgi:hypothetical protein